MLRRVSDKAKHTEVFCYPNKPVRIYMPDAIGKAIDLEKWLVQPKWNGHRALPICDEQGQVKVFSRHKAPLALAKSNFKWLSLLELPRPWALDAELLHSGRMIVWDYSVMGGEYKIKTPYEARLKELERLLKPVQKSNFSVELIETLPASQWRSIMIRQGEKYLEGFVFKNPKATDLWGPYATSEVGSQLKFRFK